VLARLLHQDGVLVRLMCAIAARAILTDTQVLQRSTDGPVVGLQSLIQLACTKAKLLTHTRRHVCM
jgi:hypothetical protein